MSNDQELHVVIGATGGTGSAIVRQLATQGKRVRAVNRTKRAARLDGVEVVAADATNAQQMRLACQDAAVVYNCVNPPFTQWAELFPRVMAGVIEGAAAAGATLVYADNTWMYSNARQPITEHTPLDPQGPKGELRVRLTEMLLDAHQSGKVRATIGRAPELYGPLVQSLLAANLFRAALTKKTARWPGRLDTPLSILFIDDFACGLIVLGQHPAAGDIWHISPAEPITGREFTRMLFEEVGQPPKVGVVSRRMVQMLGLFWPVAREGAELMYQFEAPYIVDGSKFQQAFGTYTPTRHRDDIQSTLEWYRHKLSLEQTERKNAWWREVLRYGETSQIRR